MKKLCALLTLVLLFTGCQTEKKQDVVDALADGVLTVGLDDTFAPMGFRDDNNELVGFDIDLAKAVGEKLDVEVEFVPIDWAMKETELNSANIDCIWNGYSITEDRKKQVAFSEPYLDNRQIIIVLADSDINSKDDLSDKIVAVQKESSALDAVNADSDFVSSLQDGKCVEYDTNIDCFMDLEAKRSDAIVCDEVLARYVMKQRGEEKYKVLADDFGVEEYGIGFRLNDMDTVDKVNGAIEQLKDEGAYDTIYQTWFAK